MKLIGGQHATSEEMTYMALPTEKKIDLFLLRTVTLLTTNMHQHGKPVAEASMA